MSADVTEPKAAPAIRPPTFPTSDVVGSVLVVPIVALAIWGVRVVLGGNEGYWESLALAALLALMDIGITAYRWRRARRAPVNATPSATPSD